MEFLIFVGLLAGSAWSVVYFRKTGLWGVVVATLLAGTVVGYPFFHVSVITLDRLLLAACVAIYAIYRSLGLTEPKQWNFADALFLFFLLALLGTTLRSDWRAQGGASISKLLFFFFLPVVFYWIARQIELTPGRVQFLLASMACLGLYLAVMSVAEKFDLRWAVFPRYISSPTYEEFLGRGRGPLLNPAGNGILLTLGLSCCLMGWSYFGRYGKALVACAVPIYLAGIYCTMTRSVWIGGAAAFVGIVYLSVAKRWRIPLVMAAVTCGMCVVALKSESLVGFKRDKNVSLADMKQSAQLRPILAAFAWEMFQDRPWFGCGSGQYLNHVKDYLGERKIDLPLEKAKVYVQHNVFLALLCENGLVGLLPFAGLVVVWIYWASRLGCATYLPREHRCLALVFLGFMAGFLVNGLFHDVLIIPMISSYLFFLAGCVRNLARKLILEERSIHGVNHAPPRRDATACAVGSMA